jgi:hypothetical protein
LTIAVLHYLVGKIIDRINQKLNPFNIERNKQTVNILLKLKRYHSEYEKLILLLLISSGYDFNLIIFL